ncbi:MAG: murein L,D-transpeptidase [Deltaproteobacteria bacterium]|nr:murein L,D-transpeptidase [Deltaproteobacteria bacterium]TLN03970.1 MAG: L,D-transpeptidase [bacterium]
MTRFQKDFTALIQETQRAATISHSTFHIQTFKTFSGIGKFHRWLDWMKGCVAVTNDEVDEIGRLVANGTPVEIKP